MRETFIDNLASACEQYGYQGIQIDFEGAPPSDREPFTAFITELAARLHAQGDKLSTIVTAKTYNIHSGRAAMYDDAALSVPSDWIFVLDWGIHWTTSAPGPLDEMPWFKKVAEYAATMPNLEQVRARHAALRHRLEGRRRLRQPRHRAQVLQRHRACQRTRRHSQLGHRGAGPLVHLHRRRRRGSSSAGTSSSPAALRFLVNYNSDVITYLPRASDYIHFVAYTELAMGLVFELPVVMMMLGGSGSCARRSMKKRWREAIVVLAVIAALLPGTDPVTMTAEYLPMLLLYWVSYFLVKAVEPKRGLTDFLSEPSA